MGHFQHVRPELGKSLAERAGRVVPVAPWLLEEPRAWPRSPEGCLVWASGPPATSRVCRSRELAKGWEAANVPERVWHKRPCHASRKGFTTGLRVAGADAAIVEWHVGRAAGDVGARHYVDAAQLDARAVVALVPRVATLRPDSSKGASDERLEHQVEEDA